MQTSMDKTMNVTRQIEKISFYNFNKNITVILSVEHTSSTVLSLDIYYRINAPTCGHDISSLRTNYLITFLFSLQRLVIMQLRDQSSSQDEYDEMVDEVSFRGV